MTDPPPLPCPVCNYDLAPIAPADSDERITCPECGRAVIPFTPQQQVLAERSVNRHHLRMILAPGLIIPAVIITLYILKPPYSKHIVGGYLIFFIPIALVWLPTTYYHALNRARRRDQNPMASYSMIIIFLYSLATIPLNLVLIICILLMNSVV